jgi:hypothetical protein
VSTEARDAAMLLQRAASQLVEQLVQCGGKQGIRTLRELPPAVFKPGPLRPTW